MALDVSGFTTPANQYEGLFKLSDDIRRNNAMDAQNQVRAKAQKSANASLLQSFLDPKDFLTGTNHDPIITAGVGSLLQKGTQLAMEDGMDGNMLQAALLPEVNKLHVASENLKALERQRKDHEVLLKGVKGIDIDKYNNEFKKAAYYNEDGTLKDLYNIDPNKNYTDDVLKNADVYNNEGLDDFVSKSGKNTTLEDAKFTGSNGRMRDAKVEVTMPTFMQRETDPKTGAHIGFVPKYNIATDEDAQLIHTFKNDKGEEVKAPVRMVTDEVFTSLPKIHLAKIRAEVKNLIAGTDIPIGSPHAENLAKAIAYDDLKNSAKQYSTLKETQVIKEPPAPHIRVTVNNNNKGGDVPVIDVMPEIITATKSHQNDPNPMKSAKDGKIIIGGTPTNTLSQNAKDAVIKAAGNDADGKPYTIHNTYLVGDENGNAVVYDKNTDEAITTLTGTGTILDANQKLGAKSKIKGVNQVQGNTVPQKVLKNSKGTTKSGLPIIGK